MKILVDADSCPSRVREIIVKASVRESIEAIFVANRKIPLSEGQRVSMVVAGKEESSADRYIISKATTDDLVITRDIPLASELVKQGVVVINDRGDVFTSNNIRERLWERNFMEELRISGIQEGKPSRYGRKEVKAFADTFDKELRKLKEKKGK